MEQKIKNDFNDKGEVYEHFRNNKDVFLTNNQIYDIFEKFWDENYSHLKSEDNPTLYIVGAQPGAGKTGLVGLIENETNLSVLTGDQYRSCRPNYLIFSEREKDFLSQINFVICMLMIGRCLDKQISFIMENPLKNVEQNIYYIKEAKKRNFVVNLDLMVVKNYDSYVGIYYRCINFIKNGQAGRITSNRTHDLGYDGVLKTFNYTNVLSSIDSLCLYNRNLCQLFKADKNDLQNYTFSTIERAKQTINIERNREYTEKERKDLNNQISDIIEYIDKGLLPISKEEFLKELELRKEKLSIYQQNTK